MASGKRNNTGNSRSVECPVMRSLCIVDIRRSMGQGMLYTFDKKGQTDSERQIIMLDRSKFG